MCEAPEVDWNCFAEEDDDESEDEPEIYEMGAECAEDLLKKEPLQKPSRTRPI